MVNIVTDMDALALFLSERSRGAGVADVDREKIRTLLTACYRDFNEIETEAAMRAVAWTFRGSPDYRQQCALNSDMPRTPRPGPRVECSLDWLRVGLALASLFSWLTA